MIQILTDPVTGYRRVNSGADGHKHGDGMVDQYIAILMGWALGIMERGK